MIKKLFYLLGLIIVLWISLQDQYLNIQVPNSFIERATNYTIFGNTYYQPYWVILLIFVSIGGMFYVYKKNSR